MIVVVVVVVVVVVAVVRNALKIFTSLNLGEMRNISPK